MKKLVTLGITITALATVSALADGKALYDQGCAKCHGADGKGQTKMGQKLGCKDYTTVELKEDAAIKAVKEGVKDKDGKSVMKPAEGMSDDDVKAVVAYMRTFKK